MASRFIESGVHWLAAVLFMVAAPGQAQESPAPEKEDVQKLPPEIEKKFEELMTKMQEAKAKDEAGQLKKEIANVVKVTGLDDAGQKGLEQPAGAAVESAVKGWLEKMGTVYRTSWVSNDMTLEILEQWIAQAASMARNGTRTDYVRAADQPVWKEALARALDPKQAAAWKADVDEQQRKFDEQFKGVISAATERAREQGAQKILGTVSALALTLPLDEERTKKLQKLGEQAAEKASEPMKEKARKMLLSFDENIRKQTLKNNNLYLPLEENDAPEKQEVWKEGLKEVLQPEEIVRWEAAIEKRREKRVRAMAQVLVWALDQAVAFTAGQREQLQPLAVNWVREQKGQFSEVRASGYYNVNMRQLYQIAARAKDEDLKRILDAKQITHWKDLSSPQIRRSRTGVNRAASSSTTKSGSKPSAFEPEDLEVAISDYIYDMAERELDRAIADALVQAEDVIRVAALEGKAAQRLETAARGAAERQCDAWKSGVASNIRPQFENATPADFRQRAGNVNYDMGPRRRMGSDENAKGILEKTLAAVLTESQRAAWQKEIDARKAYEPRVIVASVLATLDDLCVLTEEQRSKLDPIMVKQLEDYGPEFEQMFSNRNSIWFLQGYCALMPVAGIPEQDLRKIVSDEQWKQLNSSFQFNNARNYWRNIESNHKQRVKQP